MPLTSMRRPRVLTLTLSLVLITLFGTLSIYVVYDYSAAPGTSESTTTKDLDSRSGVEDRLEDRSMVDSYIANDALPVDELLVAVAETETKLQASSSKQWVWGKRPPYDTVQCKGKSGPVLSFAHRMFARHVDWEISKVAPPPWQSLVNHKLHGYIFAELMGVATATIKACLPSPDDLADNLARAYGTPVVIKPLHGFDSIGVTVLHKGVDMVTGKRVDRRTVISRLKRRSVSRLKALPRSTMVEEVNLNPGGLKDFAPGHFRPIDYKFYVLGDSVAHVATQTRDATKKICRAMLSPDFRTLLNGTINPRSPGNADWPRDDGLSVGCNEILPTAPPHLKQMSREAKRLGRALGAFYRVDFYDTNVGPVLGEFTPWPDAWRTQEYSPDYQCNIVEHWVGKEGGGDHPPEAPSRFLHILKRAKEAAGGMTNTAAYDLAICEEASKLQQARLSRVA